jgi:hypothetical protein
MRHDAPHCVVGGLLQGTGRCESVQVESEGIAFKQTASKPPGILFLNLNFIFYFPILFFIFILIF